MFDDSRTTRVGFVTNCVRLKFKHTSTKLVISVLFVGVKFCQSIDGKLKSPKRRMRALGCAALS